MDSMTPERKTIKMSDGPSKGRKLCPGCRQYVGVRTAKCDCGHVFEKKAESQPSSPSLTPRRTKSEAPPEPRTVIRPGCGYLTAPGGPSLAAGMKIKLEAQNPNDYEAISNWADRMIGMGQANGFNYGPQALRYFLRFYFDINSPEYKMAAGTLNQWSLEYFTPTETPIVVHE